MVAALAVAGVSCGDGAAPVPSLEEILTGAGAQFETLESVRFDIDVQGAPVYLDGAQTLEAREAAGQYAAPESFQAVVEATALGLGVELGAVSIGDRQWVTNPVTGGWEELPPGYGFDPLQLFDPVDGIGATLAGLDDATLADSGSRYHVQGTVGASRVRTLTAGLLEQEAVEIDLFIDPDSLHLLEVSFEVGDPPSMWTIGFSEFNEPVTIDPPAG